MIEQYFSAPKTLRRMRGGPCGAYLAGFVEALARRGYTRTTIIRSVRATTHLSLFLARRGRSVLDLDAAGLRAFGRHLRQCRCRRSSGRRTGFHARFGAQRFHEYLIARGLCPRPVVDAAPPPVRPLIGALTVWYRAHRGVTALTLQHYARGATAMLHALGPDVQGWTAEASASF